MWDVPGLGVDVDALLSDKAAPAAARPTAAPAVRAPPPAVAVHEIVGASPELAQSVDACHDALDSARATVHRALGSGHTHDAPAVEAWLALMDEVLNFGQAMTNALRANRSA